MTESKLAKQDSIITDVATKVEAMEANGEIQMPANYSYMNALKSAYLILQDTKDKDKRPVLQVCSRESIANSLLNMVIQGLNPAKNQGYFIPYGSQLTFQRSYLGTMAITKRIEGIDDIKGYALYKDDVFKLGFDFATGSQSIEEYSPNVAEWKAANLIGAFAIILSDGKVIHTEYMPLDQIKAAWNQGQMKGNSGAHKNFPDQMAIKTVINRACKKYVNTRDDSDLVMELLSKQTDIEVQEEIALNANTQMLPDHTDYDVDPETGEILNDPFFDTDPATEPVAPF